MYCLVVEAVELTMPAGFLSLTAAYSGAMTLL